MTLLNGYTDAAILVEQNQELVVDKIQLPKTLDVGQVLVEVSVSGICGSQIGEITGTKGKDSYLPHLLGHEGCGKILKIGPGVKTLSVGDKVVLPTMGFTKLPFDGEEYYVGPENQILAKVNTTIPVEEVLNETKLTEEDEKNLTDIKNN